MSSTRPLPPSCRLPLRWLTAAFLLLPGTGALAQVRWPEPLTPPQPSAPPPQFGAIAFTADGSFSAVWKRASKGEAEAKVLADCEKLKRGKCQVVGFRQEVCAAIASFRTGKDLRVTYAGGGVTKADAKRSALDRCNGDARAGKSCHIRTVVCGDGR